ncbi:hypothetical protein ACN28I_13465 [Archangium gephyra]|uniref:hypothetical protein n=1 Tax=Archangium gephyra TaxID=48 RepID=UPI003B7C51B2
MRPLPVAPGRCPRAHPRAGAGAARRALWQAEHELALGRREPAREATRRNLEQCQRLGWRGHVAHCHAVLGLLAVDEHLLEEGRAHLVHARAWSRASNEKALETTGQQERARELRRELRSPVPAAT